MVKWCRPSSSHNFNHSFHLWLRVAFFCSLHVYYATIKASCASQAILSATLFTYTTVIVLSYSLCCPLVIKYSLPEGGGATTGSDIVLWTKSLIVGGAAQSHWSRSVSRIISMVEAGSPKTTEDPGLSSSATFSLQLQILQPSGTTSSLPPCIMVFPAPGISHSRFSAGSRLTSGMVNF